jgi:release factor glutamine methyltransferase
LSMRFLKQDIFETPTIKTKFDIIVSNPPYVLESDRSQMSEMVLKHEPEQALFVPDNDPLLFYRRILELAPTLLNPGGKIYFEIHENKGSEMKALCLASNMSDVRIIQDMQGKERMMSMQFTQ